MQDDHYHPASFFGQSVAEAVAAPLCRGAAAERRGYKLGDLFQGVIERGCGRAMAQGIVMHQGEDGWH
jgi:hypothetical protein